MGLIFIGEVGVYLPKKDAIKITAMDGDRIIDCYATRSALRAIGCPGLAVSAEMMRQFERQRENIELAAMVKYRRALAPMVEIAVEAVDLMPILPATAA